MPSIFVESGIEEGAAYGFPPGDVVFIVGRAPNCGIVITDPLVSRQHCRIERINGRYRVVDLGSHNGVYLNDEKVATKGERELSFGDVIRLGETEMVLREEAPDDEGELAGRRLGGYQLVKRIGSGGMGEVYRGVQVGLGRPVAIKILSPELTEDRSFVRRFTTEARAAGKLNHPNVAQVHEVGEIDGIYYYSMEYLEGGSVQDKLRGGRRLPVEEAVRLALGAARALEYAEKQGVIHCDVKPDNLMLTADGEVRLADLGIARTVQGRAEKVKQEGGVLGSPHYMAPEQARGEPIDHRVDIYALGATFYRMIAGRTPFSGRNAREIMEKQVYEDPPGLRSLDPSVPQSVCRVLSRMMKKKPEKRYQAARELIADLEALQEELAPGEGAETSSRRHSRLGRRAVRRKSSAGPIIAVVVLLLVGAAFVVGFAFRDGSRGGDPQQLIRKAQFEESKGNLHTALALLRQARAAAGKGSRAFARAGESIARVKRELEARRLAETVEGQWKALEDWKARARTATDFKELAAAYERFVKQFPDSSHTPTAKIAARQFRDRYAAAAQKEVEAFGEGAAKLAAECHYARLRQEWEHLASKFRGTPAARLASRRAEDSGALAAKEFAAAKAAAEKALAEGRYGRVTEPLERFTKADINQLRAEALSLIEQYKENIRKAREATRNQAERGKKLAECNQMLKAAVALAHQYAYTEARKKFLEARTALGRAGFEAEAAGAVKLADHYRGEVRLFDRLYEYSRGGRLAAASVKLADGREARVASARAEGLRYTRGMGQEGLVAWEDLPVESVYGLLRRPGLSVDERATLARFCLERKLFKEAKAEFDKVLAAEPDRKKDLAPLLERALKGGAGKD